MLLISIFALLALSRAVFIPSEADANRAPGSQRPTNCSYTRERKTLDWNYYIGNWNGPSPHIDYIDLESPGSGFVWRGEAWYTLDVTRPILFQNGQGWRLVNCSSYFAAGDPARGGCTSPELALLSIPGTKTGDAPPEKGKIGTIANLRYPEKSYWAVYDLIEFRLTPVVPRQYYNQSITVEVFGWYENGTKASTQRFKIKGSEVGYKVTLPPGWDNIIQWQVRVWWSSGSRPTREEFPYLIDDVVINEYALVSKEFDCRYPTQTPSANAVVSTLGFDDVPAAPGIPVAIPSPYHGYNFQAKFSTLNITNSLSYPSGSLGRLSATSKPNAVWSHPDDARGWMSTSTMVSVDFLFDLDSLHITIDNTTTGTQDPRDILVILRSYGGCWVGGDADMLDAFRYVTAPAYSFGVDLAQSNFKKNRAVSVFVWDSASDYLQVPFWIDAVEVGSWRDGLGGLPGCERCGLELRYWCEYPCQDRPDVI